MANNRGISLFEVLVGMAILSLLMVTALPAINTMNYHSRLGEAAEAMQRDFLHARQKVLVERAADSIYVSFRRNNDHSWCYGLSQDRPCDCEITSVGGPYACVVAADAPDRLQVVKSGDFGDYVAMKSVDFERGYARIVGKGAPIRGGTVSLEAAERRVEVSLTPVGRVRICSNSGSGYATCKAESSR
jgi:Tfp pilus assembly protein FimT